MEITKNLVSNIYDRISKLGYFPTAFVPMRKYASIIAIKGESRYNFWVSYDAKDIIQAYLLKYKLNAGEIDKIDSVIRITIPVK